MTEKNPKFKIGDEVYSIYNEYTMIDIEHSIKIDEIISIKTVYSSGESVSEIEYTYQYKSGRCVYREHQLLNLDEAMSQNISIRDRINKFSEEDEKQVESKQDYTSQQTKPIETSNFEALHPQWPKMCPMETAPKDGTFILSRLKPDLEEIGCTYPGRFFCIKWGGEFSFWSIYPGDCGYTDDYFEGWWPLPQV